MEFVAKFDAKKLESQVRDNTEKNKILDKIRASDRKKKIWFVEGPPTMNGTPHAGHLRGRIIKDLWYRFNTLRGYMIVFTGGWDTQGLPVELQVEKELGVSGGKSEAIAKFGIDKIVSECKQLVVKYSESWINVDKLLGISMDHTRSYWTFKDEYIEREWQILKAAYENNILEKDYTVIAYCPSCQTSLSHAEVNQGYDKVQDPSLYYKVKLDDEDTFLIVWTTMPFTLVTDAMVGVHPDEDYVYLNVQNETWIVGKTRLEELLSYVGESYTIQKIVKGSNLEGKRYIHPLLDVIPELGKYAIDSNFHVIVAEDFVDASTGSGLVHISPANGEEDIKIARRRKVKIFNPIDDAVKFTTHAGKYSGMFVRDADFVIIDDLKTRGALVKIGKITHSYPLCWRSHHPIVWLARSGWFYKLDRLGDKAIRSAESVEYFFDQPKNRFLGIIKERHPWCISRERIWGCPLPVWDCMSCGEKSWFFTRDEIISAAVNLPDGKNFELHMPWIDRITIRCKFCNSNNTHREEYVLDTWHNSGAAPFASLDDTSYNQGIPAPFFTEGIDQTRGWAYTLLVENVILNNAPIPPYRSFLFQGHVLDENGGKMSKSKGNVLDAVDLLEKYPVDLVRFYFMWKSSPIEPLNFSTKEMMSRPYQVISTLFNLHVFFEQNSQYDKYKKTTIQQAQQRDLLELADIWLLSKLQSLIDKVTRGNETCKFHEAARAIEQFVIRDLSQTYIPMTRGQIWDEDTSDRRVGIYAVLDTVLKTIDILVHPLCPFTSEYLFTIFGNTNILLERWPEQDQSLIDLRLEESFDILNNVVSVAAAARMKGKLKRRWPLNEAYVCIAKGQKTKLDSLHTILQTQLNIENIQIIELDSKDGIKAINNMSELGLPINITLDLDRGKIGPKARQDMGMLIGIFKDTRKEDIARSLQETNQYTFNLDGHNITLDTDDFVIGYTSQQNYEAAERDDCLVFISTTRNENMMARGLVRDIARRLQSLRKQRGYNPTDILNVGSILGLDSESLNMIKPLVGELAFLVRVKEITFDESCTNYIDDEIDGQKIRLSVE